MFFIESVHASCMIVHNSNETVDCVTKSILFFCFDLFLFFSFKTTGNVTVNSVVQMCKLLSDFLWCCFPFTKEHERDESKSVLLRFYMAERLRVSARQSESSEEQRSDRLLINTFSSTLSNQHNSRSLLLFYMIFLKSFCSWFASMFSIVVTQLQLVGKFINVFLWDSKWFIAWDSVASPDHDTLSTILLPWKDVLIRTQCCVFNLDDF